jgi:hypothetical protein
MAVESQPGSARSARPSGVAAGIRAWLSGEDLESLPVFSRLGAQTPSTRYRTHSSYACCPPFSGLTMHPVSPPPPPPVPPRWLCYDPVSPAKWAARCMCARLKCQRDCNLTEYEVYCEEPDCTAPCVATPRLWVTAPLALSTLLVASRPSLFFAAPPAH